eukprot:3761337-Rhodomonas_salina.3
MASAAGGPSNVEPGPEGPGDSDFVVLLMRNTNIPSQHICFVSFQAPLKACSPAAILLPAQPAQILQVLPVLWSARSFKLWPPSAASRHVAKKNHSTNFAKKLYLPQERLTLVREAPVEITPRAHPHPHPLWHPYSHASWDELQSDVRWSSKAREKLDLSTPFADPEMTKVWSAMVKDGTTTTEEQAKQLSLADSLVPDPADRCSAMKQERFKQFWLDAEHKEWTGLAD